MAIPINDKLKPRNDAEFALMDAEDIECSVEYKIDDKVDVKVGRLPEFLFQCVTESEYQQLKADGKMNKNTPYLIIDG